MRIYLTATIEPESEDADSSSRTGLTEEAHEHILSGLDELGITNVRIRRGNVNA